MDHREQITEDNYKILLSFASIIQKKLTKADLEEICYQKIGDIIIHLTDLGQAYLTYKKHEEILKNLQKDFVRLTDQVENLKRINTLLQNELERANRNCYGSVKIKKSVDIQVNLD